MTKFSLVGRILGMITKPLVTTLSLTDSRCESLRTNSIPVNVSTGKRASHKFSVERDAYIHTMTVMAEACSISNNKPRFPSRCKKPFQASSGSLIWKSDYLKAYERRGPKLNQEENSRNSNERTASYHRIAHLDLYLKILRSMTIGA